jgi:hypothetical protein
MKALLLLLTSIIAITAIIGGGMMLVQPNGSSLQLSPLLLQGTPFKTFFIPGIILLLLVGGSNLIATWVIMLRRKNAFSFSLAAGIVMVIWVAAQMLFTSTFVWQQIVYLGIGILIMLTSFHLKGKELI